MNKDNFFDINKSKSLLTCPEKQHLINYAQGMDQDQINQIDQNMGQRAFDNSCMASVIAMAVTMPIVGRWVLNAQTDILPNILATKNDFARETQLVGTTVGSIMTPLVAGASVFKLAGEIVYNTIAKPIAQRHLKSNINQALTSEGISPLE